jgi:hypothetical protein
MKCIRLLLLSFYLILIPAMSNAQNEGVLQNNELGLSFFTGLHLGSDGDSSSFRSIGMNAIYHPVSFIAIEPGVYFTSSKEDEKNRNTGRITTEKDELISYGVGIYYYHNLSNNLYLYLGPRFESTKVNSKRSNNYDLYGNERETEGRNFLIVLGLKYMLNDNIGIFGDFSYGYGIAEGTEKYWDSTGIVTSNYSIETKTKSLSNSFVGVSLYF